MRAIGAAGDKSVSIIGRACRLPGAPGVAALWTLLAEGRCTVAKIPSDRWGLDRLIHPRQLERGRTYTWAAGTLDDPWGFDPAVFGLSPREAEQMDPQQRLALELTWEALEDAGIPPSEVSGSDVGVFVGASALDYANLRLLDIASGDQYFATGNTLSIISNRLSYVFNLHGPSHTVDTACSSSLVALEQAVMAIQSGRIDTAIVAGVNVLASPFGFIVFSQASMLSRRGLCQAFGAGADGYVRAEGGVALVLRATRAARGAGNRIHATIAAAGVNSDGRTSGISLPNHAQQAALLDQIYTEAGLDPDRLAFIEAHGTGTAVGDPVEARAIGEMLAQRRQAPLLIGSIKTNIGHTEPASGLAGVLKAMLALEHDLLPASLHSSELNPNIPFDELNLVVAREPVALARGAVPRLAGVSSFGFGGTNAHVVIEDGPATAAPAPVTSAPQVLLISAQSRAALAQLAGAYRQRLEAARDEEIFPIIAAAAYRRQRLPHRLVVRADDRAGLLGALDAVERGQDAPRGAVIASEAAQRASVAFVFSGNGSQWPGMGRAAHRASAPFRERFAQIEAVFTPLAGWSLEEALFAEDLDARLSLTRVAQPLIFAIQAAAAHALALRGLRSDFVLGHSVGEIAAAHACGALSLAQAVRVIHFRSLHQECTRGEGGMAVVFGTRDIAERILERLPTLEIAAFNSPRVLTLAGPFAALERLPEVAREFGVRSRRLDLVYPFHSQLMAAVEPLLAADLAGMQPEAGGPVFVSSVTGKPLSGHTLGADYWWRNVREPVRFDAAVQEAARQGARVFLEIGPSATLLSHIADNADAVGIAVASLGVLDRRDGEGDPFAAALAQALARGAGVDEERVFGPDPGYAGELPRYPWQRQTFRLPETPETLGLVSPVAYHPLIGARLRRDGLEWVGVLDPLVVPELGDHRIDGQVLLAAAAFAEMALAVARDWLGTPSATISELEIHQPMIFSDDGSREIVCRVAPAGGMLEILSRPRLGRVPWQSHASARILHETTPFCVPPREGGEPGVIVDGPTLYGIAARAGLQFGPAYRQVARAERSGDGSILVDLVADTLPVRGYGLDPARLDACFHGLILLFDRSPGEVPSAYLPIRFGEIKILQPGVSISRALIKVTRFNSRSILADFTLLSDDGSVVAALRDARYQAVRSRRAVDLGSAGVVQATVLATEPAATRGERPLTPQAIMTAARAASAITEVAPDGGPATLLLEGWAISLAMGLATSLSEQGVVDVARLIEAGRLPERLRPWFLNLLFALERSGLASTQGERWRLDDKVELPDAGQILLTLAAEHPEHAAELLIAARLGAVAGAVAARDPGAWDDASLSPAVIDALETGSVDADANADMVIGLLERTVRQWPRDRAMRILALGAGPVSRRLQRFARAHGARLTVFDPNRRRLERLRVSISRPDIGFLDRADDLAREGHDLVIAADRLHRLVPDVLDWARLSDLLAPGALLLAIEPAPSLFRDVACGLDEQWFTHGPSPDFPLGALASAEGWAKALNDAGLVDGVARTVATHQAPAILLAAGKPFATVTPAGSGDVLILADEGPGGRDLARALSDQLQQAGFAASVMVRSTWEAADPQAWPKRIIHLAPTHPQGTPAERLEARCLSLAALEAKLRHREGDLWVICPGATRDGAADAVEAGVWAFSRTLANEAASLNVRRVDLAPGLTVPRAAERLCEVVLSATDETEIVIDADRTRVVRVRPVAERSEPDLSRSSTLALRLERGEGSGLDRLAWTAVRRREPAAGEVELAVRATGLNFRDVMWALGILPEEVLEDGFAGPSLGLECAGRIVRVGPGVKGFKPGDAVVALAHGAYATHVTVPVSTIAPMPDGIPAPTAATIPVAFLTAYYGLVTCARLKKREWVLIHGGAGGVGLAALQIARWRGARIVATAGTAEKRDLIRALGADLVFDSRSAAFVDEIRAATGGGVDVILNSLSGEAMERSLNLLRPFGRFIELGKRDFVADTRIGLRPFRRNLTYFGVDLDQLILADPTVGSGLFREVMKLFAKGVFSPLPYRRFAAGEVEDAFRLMQQSGHVGKIVVSAPLHGEVAVPVSDTFKVAADRTHLITGGLGGFGLEVARWLADRGATSIVLVGRGGATAPGAVAAVEALAARGVRVRVAACDVADVAALEAVLADIERTLPPLGGVIHAAMVLNDAVIRNITPENLNAVIRPKVTGAVNLDRLTRNRPLDYFILFSSATTVIGNPGQGSYVAANGFLEGLARRRRQEGLPALAVAWGAIEDVGVLARNGKVMDGLASRMDLRGLSARQALDLMEQVLAQPGKAEQGVVAIAPIGWSKARDHLAVLRSPTFRELVRDGEEGENTGSRRIDLADLVARGEPDTVRREISGLVVEEIARILRLPQEDVSRVKPLTEIGLDSLMAIELATSLQERFGLEVTLSASASGLTVPDLTDQIIASATTSTGGDAENTRRAVAERHFGTDLGGVLSDDVVDLVERKSHEIKEITS